MSPQRTDCVSVIILRAQVKGWVLCIEVPARDLFLCFPNVHLCLQGVMPEEPLFKCTYVLRCLLVHATACGPVMHGMCEGVCVFVFGYL